MPSDDVCQRLFFQRAHLLRYGVAEGGCEAVLHEAANALGELSALVNELNRRLVLGDAVSGALETENAQHVNAIECLIQDRDELRIKGAQ